MSTLEQIIKLCPVCMGDWIDYEHSIGTSEEFIEDLSSSFTLVTAADQCEGDDHAKLVK